MNKKKPKLTLESILSNHDQKTIYFDVIACDYEVFAKFEFDRWGIDRDFHKNTSLATIVGEEEYRSSILRIEIYGDIYWDSNPLGEVKLTVWNRDFGYNWVTPSGRFLFDEREIVCQENHKRLEHWLQLLQLCSVDKRELAMNIEFESFSVENPNPQLPHNVNSWSCSTIFVQSGSNKLAKIIEEKASKKT